VASGASGPLVLLLATLAVPAAASADPLRARLVYVVAPDAEACPSADDLRAAVNARAGHELFGEPPDVTLEIRIGRAGGAHVATVSLPDAPGGGGATRELRSDVGCAELATAVALVASIAIDPASALQPAPPPPPPAPRAWRGFAGLGPRATAGVAPGAVAGLALSAGAVGRRGTLGLELGGFLPGDASYAGGRVAVLPLTVSLLPCASRGHWEACGVAALGLVRGAGAGFSENLSAWKAFAGLGARGGLGVGAERFRLRLFVELLAVLPRTTFLIGDAAAYTTRGVSVGGGLDGLMFF
jgi:hypothetical protein